MDLLTILLIAIGLAMDSFAVSLAIGTTTLCNDRRSILSVTLHFGVFQAVMPVLGWLAGTTIARFIAAYDHWVAFGLLAYIGVSMIISGFKLGVKTEIIDPNNEKTLLMLSLATSIDALAVGLSMALLSINIVLPVIIIGIVTMALSELGLHVGDRLGLKFGKTIKIIGGMILLFIGIRIVIIHLL